MSSEIADSWVPSSGNTRVWSTLEVIDVLLMRTSDKHSLIPLLRNAYNIDFEMETSDVWVVISLTSKKCLLRDSEGNRYFLKQKPFYCVDEDSRILSSGFQNFLWERTWFVPTIIKTFSGESYFEYDGVFYFLTPYIEWQFFDATPSQYILAAKALWEIHRIENEFNSSSRFETSLQQVEKMLEVLHSIKFPDPQQKTIVLDSIHLAMSHYNHTVVRKGHLHWDFSPYNIVFGDSRVLAVNDFDNVFVGNLDRDLAEMLLTFCGVNYAGTTTSLRMPVCRKLNLSNIKLMLDSYLEVTGLRVQDVASISSEMPLIFLELLVLWLIRGDYSIEHVLDSIDFHHIIHQEIEWLLSSYSGND